MKKKKLWLTLLVSATCLGLVSTAQAAADNEPGRTGIHVDQVGYLTDYQKKAMIADADTSDFELIDTVTGKTVYQGKLSAPKLDNSSQEKLSTADFSDFKTPGTYRLKAGTRESYDFEIGDNVYAGAAHNCLRSYSLTRANQGYDDSAVTGIKLEAGHMQDEAAEVYFTEEGICTKGEKLNELGGWYDAGDYGKYVPTGAISAAELMMAYEAHPKNFTRGQIGFPVGIQTDAKLPDVLTEVKYELDWLRKMQRSDGSLFNKVADHVWTGDMLPIEDKNPRYIIGATTFGTAMYGATMAMAARLYAPYDAAYAKAMLDDAQFAWEYLEKHPKMMFRRDPDQDFGSGNYETQEDVSFRCWCAAELLRTTGDLKYETYLKGHLEQMLKKPDGFGWGGTGPLAQYAYVKAAAGDPVLKEQVKAAYLSGCNDFLKKIQSDGFNCALADWEYYWASSKVDITYGDLLLLGNDLSPNPEYVEGALSQIHYILGRNSLDRSFVTGTGDNPPIHAHSRLMGATGKIIPGVLVGGPNKYTGGDPLQTALVDSGKVPPAKCYLDDHGSWSTNEYAIDYTGVAAMALSWFAKG